MKNPFIKEEHDGGLIAGLIIGAIATAGIAYLYLQKRRQIAEAAAYAKEHAKDYLKDKAHPLKKHKTDVHDLESIVTHQQM